MIKGAKYIQHDSWMETEGSVPSTVYTRDYYLTCCQGHEQFVESMGQVLPARLLIPLNLAGVRPGMRVLDVGCGRGEIVLQCARRGATAWGLDYAEEAILVAREGLTTIATPEDLAHISIMRSNARSLPFPDNSMDVVFMLDVVEHLYPKELTETFTDIWRVLRPGGQLVIHTMPNLWYYHYGYPIYRVVQRLRREQLPPDPRFRWDYHEVHVNEQTPTTLHHALATCGYQAKVWLRTTQDYSYEPNPVVRWGMKFLTKVYPFRWIFCNDIFAIGCKPKG